MPQISSNSAGAVLFLEGRSLTCKIPPGNGRGAELTFTGGSMGKRVKSIIIQLGTKITIWHLELFFLVSFCLKNMMILDIGIFLDGIMEVKLEYLAFRNMAGEIVL